MPTNVRKARTKKGAKKQGRFVTVDYSGATRLDVYRVLQSGEADAQISDIEKLIEKKVGGFANLSRPRRQTKAG